MPITLPTAEHCSQLPTGGEPSDTYSNLPLLCSAVIGHMQDIKSLDSASALNPAGLILNTR